MNQKPLYVKVSDILRDDINSGKYKALDKLPSENMLANKYSISRLTARQALSVLVNEGLIEKFQGKGYFCKNSASGKHIHVLLDMTDYYFIPYYIHSIGRVLEENGATFIAGDTKNSFDEIIKLLEKITASGSDGIILQVSPEESFDKEKISNAFKKLEEKKIPIIQIDADYGVDGVSYTIMNEEKMGFTAANYFKDSGHSKIAAVYVTDNRICVQRLGAFIKEFDNPYIIYDDDLLKENLIKAYNEGVTGIFCYSDFVAKKCIDVFSSLNIKIPENISLISADDTLVSKLYKLTAMTHAKEALGEFAAKAIISNQLPVYKIFDTSLIERNSVK